jgi:hypothetical protein
MQIMGRLRQPGTCTLFTTSRDLAFIVENNRNSFAIEMASLILAHRSAGTLASAIFDVIDGNTESHNVVPRATHSEFRFDMFQRLCQSLVAQVAVMHEESSCLYCYILGNKGYAHANVDCPWSKKTCNKCFTPGHNRTHCRTEACIVPQGFCVMCLMPVHSVYGIHSSRYGKECSGELRDCMKPLVTLLYHSSGSHVILHAVSQFLWSPKCPKPPTFTQYWAWLWHESGDHVFGILKLLHALVQCVTNRNRG